MEEPIPTQRTGFMTNFPKVAKVLAIVYILLVLASLLMSEYCLFLFHFTSLMFSLLTLSFSPPPFSLSLALFLRHLRDRSSLSSISWSRFTSFHSSWYHSSHHSSTSTFTSSSQTCLFSCHPDFLVFKYRFHFSQIGHFEQIGGC